MAMFKDVADIKTADMLNLPVPQAHYETVIVEPSDLQKEMVQELSERAAEVHAHRVDASVDNMLKITTDGRKIGLEQRLINPLLPDFEGSKVNACVGKIFEVWEDISLLIIASCRSLLKRIMPDSSKPQRRERMSANGLKSISTN
jgi:hypothetical protein